MFPLRRLLTIILTLTSAAATMAADGQPITPQNAAKLVAEGKAVLVDVREPPEWKDSGVAAPAVLLPMSDFNGEQKLWKPFLAKHKDQQILLYCRSGGRSREVAGVLIKQGVKAANIGTLRDWTNAGLPVRKVE